MPKWGPENWKLSDNERGKHRPTHIPHESKVDKLVYSCEGVVAASIWDHSYLLCKVKFSKVINYHSSLI